MEPFKKLSLSGKVVIVTGSTAGIGRATALLMAARGAKLTLHGRQQTKLDDVVAEVMKISGSKPFTVLGNVEDESVREKLISGTKAQFKKIDVLVNNAGWLKVGTLEQTSVADLRTMLEVHVVAPFDLCKRALPYLTESKGNIVMVSSIAGMKGEPHVLAYTVAKAGLDNMMRSLSADLGPKGIRVNCVNPGQTRTDIFGTEEVQQLIKTMSSGLSRRPNSLNRVGESEEVAEVIAFLASDAASMINGATYTVDGGRLSAIE